MLRSGLTEVEVGESPLSDAEELPALSLPLDLGFQKGIGMVEVLEG